MLRIEDLLIRYCCHLEIDHNLKEKIVRIFSPGLNWADFLEKAKKEKVAALMYRAFSKSEELRSFVPPEAFTELKNIYHSTAGRNLLICQGLEILADRFKKGGIEFILFKGLALAESVYQNLGLRASGDLDILVKIKDLLRADDILESLGYKKPFQFKDFSRITPSAYRNSFLYTQPDNYPEHFHLFWHLINLYPYRRDIAAKIDMERIWRAAIEINVGNRKLLTFSLHHQILYLCLHALTHLYKPFILLCDIHEIICLEKEKINWGELVQEAFNFGLTKYVYYGLYFASRILGTEIPEEVLSRLKPKKLSFFEQRFIADILADRVPFNERCRLFLLYLSMNETLPERMAFIYKMCFPPKKELFLLKLKDPAAINSFDYLKRMLGRG